MTYKPKEPKWDWRSHLTLEEAALADTLEADIFLHKDFIAKDAAELAPIRNRAIHRAKRAAKGIVAIAPARHKGEAVTTAASPERGEQVLDRISKGE